MFNFWNKAKISKKIMPTIKNTSTELDSYLEYYTRLQEPGYAVLVTGAWGTGKSHQTINAIGSNSIYISLFGSHTAEDIYSSVFAKMFPTKAKLRNVGKSIQEVSVELGGAGMGVGGFASGVINAFIRENIDNSKTIIFDDLERSNTPLKDCLGAINKYVEHYGCKVVVIAHDEKLKQDFIESKEKIFGHVITALPQYEAAYKSFIEKYETPQTQNYLAKHEDIIIKIMKDSNCKSLRILKHVIEDLSRLFETLDQEHTSNEEALSEITNLFTALNLEARNGALNKDDIIGRSNALFTNYLRQPSNDKKTEPSKILDISNRHPGINIASQLLNDEVITSMLFNGIFDERLIKKSLNNSLHYTTAKELAPWLAFMHLDEIPDHETEEIAQKLIHQFNNRELLIAGEILHLFAFRLLKTQIGHIKNSINDTFLECRKYLDDLVSTNKMPIVTKNPWGRLEIGDSYSGYGYWVDTSYKTQFNELLEYMLDCSALAIRKNHPSMGEDMLALIKNDSAKFVETISGKIESESWYAYTDVLTAIHPSAFVEALISIPPLEGQNIIRALKERHNLNTLSNHLKNEAHWIIQVINLLEQERDKSAPLRKMRLQRFIPLELNAVAQRAIENTE